MAPCVGLQATSQSVTPTFIGDYTNVYGGAYPVSGLASDVL
jgi:hypothetical protein